jgi:hypothetical protein
MIKNSVFLGVFVICIWAGAFTSFAADLNGVWRSDSGGTYYIRQLQNEIWWFGEESSNDPGWSNVAHGTLKGNKLDLKWSDVPKGSAMSNGILVIELADDGKLIAKKKTGGFSDSEWTKKTD